MKVKANARNEVNILLEVGATGFCMQKVHDGVEWFVVMIPA